MVSAQSLSMRSATALSIFLHLLVALLIVGWTFWRPFQPAERRFEEVEIIDTETFEALVAQSQAGADGDDVADAPSADQEAAPEAVAEPEVEDAPATPDAVVDEPEVEEPAVEEVIEETPAPPPPVPEPAVQPDNLPDPVFDPRDTSPAQPLSQAEEADRSGIAEPESEGQEQAQDTTNIPAPPARDAAQLREIAEESSTPSVNEAQAEVVVTESDDAQTDAEEQDAAEIDATDSIQPEADAQAPLTASPELAIAPPSRPATLAEAPLPQEAQTAETPTPSEAPAAADNAVADTETAAQTDNADTAESAAVETPADGAEAENSSGTNDADEIDDLLNSVLEADQGTQSGGRGLSRVEEAALTQKIHNNWVKTPLVDKDNLRDLVITVRFNTDRFGNLVDDVRMIYPLNPTPDHWIAFQTARRAILDSMPLEMPPDIDPSGVIWTINFDPSIQTRRVN